MLLFMIKIRIRLTSDVILSSVSEAVSLQIANWSLDSFLLSISLIFSIVIASRLVGLTKTRNYCKPKSTFF